MFDIHVTEYVSGTWETDSDLVHVHLEDIMAHHQAKGNVQEPVSSFVGIKGGEVGGLLIKVYGPKAIFGV